MSVDAVPGTDSGADGSTVGASDGGATDTVPDAPASPEPGTTCCRTRATAATCTGDPRFMTRAVNATQAAFEASKRGEAAPHWCELYFHTAYDRSVAPPGGSAP